MKPSFTEATWDEILGLLPINLAKSIRRRLRTGEGTPEWTQVVNWLDDLIAAGEGLTQAQAEVLSRVIYSDRPGTLMVDRLRELGVDTEIWRTWTGVGMWSGDRFFRRHRTMPPDQRWEPRIMVRVGGER